MDLEERLGTRTRTDSDPVDAAGDARGLSKGAELRFKPPAGLAT
jgi:hypothetical protein